MLFPHFPRYHWWSVSYKKSTKMVDTYQTSLEAWLQDASLFRNELVDYPIDFPIDDLTSNEKTNIEGSQATLGLSDLGWLDEKVDLSIFHNSNGLLDHSDETETLIDDDAAFLLGLLDGSFNPSYLSSDSFKNSEIELADCLNTQNFLSDASPEMLDTHLASPGCTALQVNSPVFFPAQSPASLYSDISDTPEESSSVLESSETIASDVTSSSLCSPVVHVTVCDDLDEDLLDSSNSVLSIEEVSNSMKKRKFVSNGGKIPKVKVILKESLCSSRKNSSRPKDRRERKKVQNKEAAARYRIKKRMEERGLSGEVSDLETEQKNLKKKHDELQSEIKYLKNLMCEMLQKKGIM